MQTQAIKWGVERWAAWLPGGLATEHEDVGALLAAEVPLPGCQFVDAGMRRRLSPLARVALSVAQHCLDGVPQARVVFASRHGEVNKTHKMLLDMCAGEDISPTGFGLSVHNAVPGLLSILRGDPAACTAVAAGEGSLGAGLFQAALEQAVQPQPVLLLFADIPLLPFYQGVDDELAVPLGLGLLLRPGAGDWRLQRGQPAPALSTQQQILQLLALLAGEQSRVRLPGGRAGWELSHA